MEGSSTNDVIEIRLPLKAAYLQVLRAAVGAIAGTMSFNYDEIMYLRVAVSEIFDSLIRHVTRGERLSKVNELVIRFAVQPDKMEILITPPPDYTCDLDSEENQESLALLKSLMDELEYVDEKVGFRLVKYRSPQEV